MAERGLLAMLKRQLSPQDEDISPEIARTSRAARQSRSGGLTDMLMGAAKGYADGAQSDIPEVGLARGFGGGYDTAQTLGENRIKQGNRSNYRLSDLIPNLRPEQDKEVVLSPEEASTIKARFTPKEVKKTIRLKLSDLSPGVRPELDRDVEVDETKAAELFAQQGRDLYKEQQSARAAKEKEEEAARSLVVPGFEPTGQVKTDETEAKKLREGTAEFKIFMDGLRKYEGLISKYGTAEILDRDAAAQMKAVAKFLQLKVKNLGQLGVLSISDIPFIERQIPDPGIFKTGAGMQGAVKATKEMMTKSILSRMEASGYKPTREFESFINQGAAGGTPTFSSVEEAEASGHKGEAIVGGRKAVIE